jgi:hypothetical protein
VNARSTFKPRDVEEPIDFWLNRPLASVLVKVLAPLPITPNQVTVLSGLVGVAAGVVIATAPLEPSFQIPIGGLVLYVSILLDCADGQLARLRGVSSLVGRFLDGCVDVVSIAATFVGFAIWLYRGGVGFWPINIIGWAAGYAMKIHVHGYDHAKNLYLANTRPESERAKAMPTVDEILQESARLRAEGDRFGATVVAGFARFSNSQRQGWQRGRIGLGIEGARDDRERALYATRFGTTMRLWTWDGLGLHLFMFVIACFVTPFYRLASPVVCIIYLVPMNLLTAYIVLRERQIERELQADFGRRAPDPALAP